MKYLICSDIHGSAAAAGLLIGWFEKLRCDRLVILGDTLYHGPRNPLPPGHDPKGVVDLLNPYADRIVACRGNCDAEVDQMLLAFPTMGDTALIVDDGVRLVASHGHVYSPERLPPLSPGDVFLSGHTHVQMLEKNADGVVLCNPGSAALPKGGSPAGFAVYEARTLTLYDMNGTELRTLRV